MFRSSANRLRAWWTAPGELLADELELELGTQDPEDYHAMHPHRFELRWDRSRRAGSVPARPAYCLSPVRAADRSDRQPAQH